MRLLALIVAAAAGRMGPGLAWSVACGCAGIERGAR